MFEGYVGKVLEISYTKYYQEGFTGLVLTHFDLIKINHLYSIHVRYKEYPYVQYEIHLQRIHFPLPS